MPQLFRARHRHHHVLPGHNSAFNSEGFHHTAGGSARDAFAPLQYTSAYLPTTAPRYDSGVGHFSIPPPLSEPLRVSSSASASGQAREVHHDHDLQAGAEPGVNPRSGKSAAEYGHFKQRCVIDVIDYDCDEVVCRRYDNEDFIALLKGEKNGRGKSMDDADASTEDDESGSLPPRMVRWINIGGIDWDVLRSVALKYNLHSLTLEDILHEQGHTHSKADYYPGHLFIRVLSHTLNREHHFKHHVSLHHDTASDECHGHQTHNDSIQNRAPNTTVPQQKGHASPQASHPAPNPDETPTSHLPRLDLEGGGGNGVHEQDTEGRASDDSISKTHIFPCPPMAATSSEDSSDATKALKGKVISNKPNNVPDSEREPANTSKIFEHFKSHLSLRKRMTALSGFGGPDREKRRHELDTLKDSEHRVVVDTRPIFVYLLPDGTVISLQSAPSLEYSAPIAERLHRADSVLRTSEDASLLVESLLDLVVDRVLEVVDEYQATIGRLERDILLYPVMQSVRALHILSGDLIMHKRTLQPIHTMISGLRQYDLDRCCAVADNVAAERRFMMSAADDSETDFGGGAQVSDAEEDETETEAETRRAQGQSSDEGPDRRLPPGSPASASSLTPLHRRFDSEAQLASMSSSTTVQGSHIYTEKDFMDAQGAGLGPDSEAQYKPKGSEHKHGKKKSKKKNARVVDVDPPPEYDIQAKAQRRRQRKRAWLRAERSRPSPVDRENGEQTRTAAHGTDGGSRPSPGPGPPPYLDYGAGAQYHDERGYMSPVHRQIHMRGSRLKSAAGHSGSRMMATTAAQRPPRVVGYFSYKAKVYLADVTDHMDFALSSLETFAGITENLIDYAFNMASYDMNIAMNRLTLVTTIFLPLTLMTGYFGMNFTPFWSVDKHSDVFFWQIAVPVMAFLVPLFMLDEIRKGVRYLKRRNDTRQAVRYHGHGGR